METAPTQPVGEMIVRKRVSGQLYGRRVKAKRARRSVLRKNMLLTSRFVFNTILAGSDVTPTGTGTATFTLQDVPGYTDFTNTFDAYCITGIKYRWACIRVSAQTGSTVGGTTGLYPRVMWAYDFNDTTAPTSFAEVQQYDNAKEVYLTDAAPASKWFYVKPKTLDTIAGGYSSFSNRWLRINEANVIYYGIKYAYDSNQASQQLRLEAYYTLEFKNVK